MGGAFVGALVDEGVGGGECFGDFVGEGVGVGDGEEGGPVGPGEVGDLVGDRPAGGGGVAGPVGVVEVGDELVEFLALVVQVVDDGGHGRRVGHGALPRDTAVCGWEHGSVRRNKQACLH